MSLKERINEALQSLVEANIKPSDLRGDTWNNAYNASKYDMSASSGKKLYRVKLYQKAGGPEGPAVKYLKVGNGLDSKKTYFTKKWMKKNLNTANFTFSDVEAGGSVFDLGPEEVKALKKTLSSWKAKSKLSYDKVSIVEVPDKDTNLSPETGGDDALSEDSINLSNDKVIQLYISEVFNKIKAVKPGQRFWGDFAATSQEPSSEAVEFYNNYLNTTQKRQSTLEETKRPLWGNQILLISLYLYSHGYRGDDLVVKAATIANKLPDSETIARCEGFSMELAINPTLLKFSSQEYGSVVQLCEHIVNSNGGYENKNERVRSASDELKEDIVKYIVIKPSGSEEENFKAVEAYVLDRGLEHLAPGKLNSVNIQEAQVNSYQDIKTKARLVLLTSIGNGSSLTITADVDGKNLGWFWLTWDSDQLYTDDKNKFLAALIKEIGASQNKRARIVISKDKKSKDFVDIKSVDIPNKDKIVRLENNNKVAEIDFSDIQQKEMRDFEITYDEGDNLLSFLGATKSIDIPADESVSPEKAEENGAAEEIKPEAIDTATELKNLGLLDEIEPDGTDDGEMIRGCTVTRGDIITGHDGKYYTVLKKNIGNGKWDIKSGTKILRWKKDVVDKIKEMGFSLNPGNWGKTGVTRESLMTDLGYVKNDLND